MSGWGRGVSESVSLMIPGRHCIPTKALSLTTRAAIEECELANMLLYVFAVATPGHPTLTPWAYDVANQVLFIHIPMNGGSTIQAAMAEHIPGDTRGYARTLMRCTPTNLASLGKTPVVDHMPEWYALAAIRSCLNQSTANLTTFAIVREPVELRMSVWRWIKSDRNHDPWWRAKYNRSFRLFVIVSEGYLRTRWAAASSINQDLEGWGGG